MCLPLRITKIVTDSVQQYSPTYMLDTKVIKKHKVGWNDDSEMVYQFFWFFTDSPKII